MAILRHDDMEGFKRLLSDLRYSVSAPYGWKFDEVVIVNDAEGVIRIRFDADAEPGLALEEADRRSEERRVGKEGRARWSRGRGHKKTSVQGLRDERNRE